MEKNEMPTPEDLRGILRYDPETGQLFWLPRDKSTFKSEAIGNEWNKRFAGSEVGYSIDRYGYKRIRICHRRYLLHRVAWAIQTGEWPIDQLDHINRVRTDNRFCNLRQATNSENQRNRALSKTNTSGFRGVHWSKQTRKWVATIKINGGSKSLGYFEDKTEASEKFLKYAKAVYGEFFAK